MWKLNPEPINWRRPLAALGLVLLVILAPWWFSLIFFLLALWRWPNFYEGLIPALFFDLLYGAPAWTPLGLQFFTAVAAIILVAVSDELRRELGVV